MNVSVGSWSVAELSTDRYDVFLCALGFEARSRYIAESFAPVANARLAIAFADRRELSYEKNEAFFRSKSYDVHDYRDTQFTDAVVEYINRKRNATATGATLCIDISSMSRVRIAGVVLAAKQVAETVGFASVDFLYAVAQYSAPPIIDAAPVHAGPVLPEFAGWTTEPEKPARLVVGLGYELDRALGAVDLLEPADVWAFIPRGVSQDYDDALSGANAVLLRLVADDAHKIFYSVDRPLDCFVKLESFVRGACASSRPIVIPFGPKVFALAALITGLIHSSLAIWRISFGQLEPAIERIPNGMVTGLRVTFAK